MTDLKNKILSMVKDDLLAIETELNKNLTPNLDLVKNVSKHILFSGGKRLRPLLMILSTRLCDYKGSYDVSFSTIFEYLHTATLLHDDLVDKASVRRGKKVANIIYGNSTAVLVGDFLFARSLTLAAETENPEIIKIIANITEQMSQGEIHQLLNKENLDLSQEEYFKIIQAKTAVLIQGACKAGALLAEAPEDSVNALNDFGYHLGVAFQIADDLLDYTADSAILGKETGADLKEGKLTLPVIYTLEMAKNQKNENDYKKMGKIIKNSDFSSEDFKILKDLLEKYKGIEYTEKIAKSYINHAKQALAIFGDSKLKEVLFMLADYALVRKV